MKGFAETQAAYRFFQNEKVTAEHVLSPHNACTVARIKCHDEVLLIQDTTELDYSGKQEKIEGLGRLNHEERQGIFLHPVIAVTRERLCLGVVGAQIYARSDEHGSATRRKKTRIEDKESYRWLVGYEQCCEVAEQAPDTKIIVVGDRESDIYDLFVEAEYGEADWIIRGRHNRRLVGQDSEARYLIDTLIQKKPLGKLSCDLPSQKDRAGRKAKLTIYASEVVPRGPYSNNKKLPEVKISAVFAREEGNPPDSEPIEWLLLTSLPVTGIEEANDVVDRYLCRWQVEIFFRTLKSGCTVEKLRLETLERLRPCLAMYMIVAWRVMFCMMLGRTHPDISCEILFEEFEWKAAFAVTHKKKPPNQPPTLGEMTSMIARFGGYLGRKNDPPPGPTAMWIGMQALFGYAVGFQTATEIYGLG